MRVALILYGFFRTFEFCKDSLKKHVLDILDPDIYINTPYTLYAAPEHEVPEYHHLYSRYTDPVESQIINFFQADKIKACHIRQYKSVYYQQFILARHMPKTNEIGQYNWRTISTLHSIALAIQSFKSCSHKNGIDYDLVILTRPDLKYYKDFNLSNIKLTDINYPSHHLYDPYHTRIVRDHVGQVTDVNARIRLGAAPVFGSSHQFNDQIMCGTPNTINNLGKSFGLIPVYYKEGIMLNTETYLGMYCVKNHIDLNPTDLTLYEMWRPNQPDY